MESEWESSWSEWRVKLGVEWKWAWTILKWTWPACHLTACTVHYCVTVTVSLSVYLSLFLSCRVILDTLDRGHFGYQGWEFALPKVHDPSNDTELNWAFWCTLENPLPFAKGLWSETTAQSWNVQDDVYGCTAVLRLSREKKIRELLSSLARAQEWIDIVAMCISFQFLIHVSVFASVTVEARYTIPYFIFSSCVVIGSCGG